MTHKAASELAKARWRKIPIGQRRHLVPRNGGRPRIYPQCRLGKYHKFNRRTGECKCGQTRFMLP